MAAEAPTEELDFEFPAKEAKGSRKAKATTDPDKIREEAQDSADRLEHVITPVQEIPRSRVRARTPARGKAYTAAESAVLAPTVVNLANLAAVAWVGPEAVMQAHENALIQPPLERILARMPAETARKANFIVDPLLIVVGMGMWGARIIQIQAAKKAREKVGTVEQQAERLRANGVQGSEYTSEPEPLPVIDHGAPYVNGNGPQPATVTSTSSNAPVGGIPDAIRDSFGETEEEPEENAE